MNSILYRGKNQHPPLPSRELRVLSMLSLKKNARNSNSSPSGDQIIVFRN
jgi:hypothetical protein